MTPETKLFVEKAHRLLAEAEGMLTTMHYNKAAGRTAYPTGFHAAQALISEKTGRSVKPMVASGPNFTGASTATPDLTTRCGIPSVQPTISRRSRTTKPTPVPMCRRRERAARAIAEARLLVAKVAEVLDRA